MMKLTIQGLKKAFDKKEVLRGIDFQFRQGKIYGLLGRNGAGKTTFFNCINEDIPVDEGQFLIETADGRESLKRRTSVMYFPRPTSPNSLQEGSFSSFSLK